jgi:nucleoid DNA-binding protein
MNKAALIEKIHTDVGVSKKDAERMLMCLTSTIIDELIKGNEVTITGFGTFLSRTRHARGGVNPQNPSERIQIPEVKVAKFKTGKTLKDALKGKLNKPEEKTPAENDSSL